MITSHLARLERAHKLFAKAAANGVTLAEAFTTTTAELNAKDGIGLGFCHVTRSMRGTIVRPGGHRALDG